MGRILRDTDTTLRKAWLADGSPQTGKSITVTVTDLDGNTVKSGSATEDGATGYYEFTIDALDAPDVALWDSVWDDGADQVVTERLEVVGGWLFTELAARSYDNGAMANVTDYPDSDILDERDRLTDIIETLTGRSWVPRFRRFVLEGSGSRRLWLRDFVESEGGSDGAGARRDTVKVLNAWVGGVAVSAANIKIDPRMGFLIRTDATWTKPTQTDPFNVTVDVEYGVQQVTEGVDWAALALLRDRLVPSNIPDRALSWTDEFGNINLDTMPTVAREWFERHDHRLGIG